MQLISLVYLDPELRDVAQHWADRFALSLIDGSNAAIESTGTLRRFITEQFNHQKGNFVLVLSTDGLALHTVGPENGNMSIRADFYGPSVTYRRRRGGGRKQMIAKAIGIRGDTSPYVLDATAGLGGDAFVLASLGCKVTLLERVSIVYALLEDGIIQARQYGAAQDPNLPEILDRMHLIEADAKKYMDTCSVQERPDVVYLDPMFPPRTKAARVKKEMQVFHALIGSDDDAGNLLESALKCALRRVVVKRPRKGAFLSGPEPSHSLQGKRNRYDIYTL